VRRYLYSYANKVVVAIKNRIRKDDLIDTGALLNSIDYVIKNNKKSWVVEFKIGDGIFVYGSGKPSEYGVYHDLGTIYLPARYFFSAPIPGLTKTIFKKEIAERAKKDISNFYKKEMKKIIKAEIKKK